MRQERTVQATIFQVFAQHDIGCELKAMSQWLDGQRGLISLVSGDLRRQGVRQTGRRGLPAESVLRCALLKQQRQLSYEELAFHLEDSASFRAFARLPLAWSPKKSVLHHTIAAIRAETWEAINRALLASAKQDRLESGATVRLDSTVTEALMHEPSDSTLLSDAVRVMTRLLDRAGALPGAPAIRWRDRRRLARKRARAIEYSRGQDKKRQLYRDLVRSRLGTEPSAQMLDLVHALLRDRAELSAGPRTTRELLAADLADPSITLLVAGAHEGCAAVTHRAGEPTASFGMFAVRPGGPGLSGPSRVSSARSGPPVIPVRVSRKRLPNELHSGPAEAARWWLNRRSIIRVVGWSAPRASRLLLNSSASRSGLSPPSW